MTDTKKFLFDTHDFNRMKADADNVTYTEEQLIVAKDQSFAQGRADGVKEARQQQEERLADLLQKTLGLTEKLVAEEERREIEKYIETTKLAIRIAHKLIPRFAQQYALPEIERVIVQSIEARRDEPRIAVTVPTQHLDALKARMDALALEKGYAGKVILLADDNLALTDCRVEWADGGAERIYERIFSQIENEFAKATTGMHATLEQEKK